MSRDPTTRSSVAPTGRSTTRIGLTSVGKTPSFSRPAHSQQSTSESLGSQPRRPPTTPSTPGRAPPAPRQAPPHWYVRTPATIRMEDGRDLTAQIYLCRRPEGRRRPGGDYAGLPGIL